MLEGHEVVRGREPVHQKLCVRGSRKSREGVVRAVSVVRGREES